MLKTAQRLHNGHIVPTNAVIHLRHNREMYISGISDTNCLIKYLDTSETENVPYNECKALYFPFCKEPEKK